MEEIQQLLNECSGNLELEEYRDLLNEVIGDCKDRLNALDDDK